MPREALGLRTGPKAGSPALLAANEEELPEAWIEAYLHDGLVLFTAM